jgi:protein phosphatase
MLIEELADNLDNPDSDPCDSVTTVPKVSEPATAFLPMELLSFEEFGTTDRGRQRYHNEDYFGIYSQCQRQQTSQHCKLEGQGLYIICDGMGGHASGEVASALAVEALHQYFLDCGLNNFPTADTIKQGIWQANQKLYLINQQNASMGSGRMGTTLVMMSVDNTKVAISHVGDSRIYRVTRKWGLEKLTVDHEVGQKAIQSGLDPIAAYSRPDAYQLTQALGPLDEECVHPDVRFLELQEDTLFLLCSDGLSDNNLVEGNWEELLLPLLSFQLSLEPAMKKLIDFANQHNGHDNISAILVRLKVRPTPNR